MPDPTSGQNTPWHWKQQLLPNADVRCADGWGWELVRMWPDTTAPFIVPHFNAGIQRVTKEQVLRAT